MTNQLHTYALISAFFDKGHDYYDAFVPFILHALLPDVSKDVSDIQEHMKNMF